MYNAGVSGWTIGFWSALGLLVLLGLAGAFAGSKKEGLGFLYGLGGVVAVILILRIL